MSYGIFLPILAYLNKIEPWWLVLKNGMKRWDELERFRDGVDAALNKVLTYLRSAINLRKLSAMDGEFGHSRNIVPLPETS